MSGIECRAHVLRWAAMHGQIVEITTDGSYLSLKRGFLDVAGPDGPLGQVPLDDVEAVLTSTPAVSYSNQLLSALAERNAPLVICSRHFTPEAYLIPTNGHHAQGLRFEAQAGATRPTKKRLWKDLVKAKIRGQAAVLAEVGKPATTLLRLSENVKSDDSSNVEATAAQHYWPALFGPQFRRDRSAENVNMYLNYGYTVLRAATARAVVSAGLHPSLGLHHQSGGDALRLADDLMEPFRSAVDLMAYEMSQGGETAMTPALKRRLAGVLHADYRSDDGVSTLSNALVRLSQSLAQVFLQQRKDLVLPLSAIPLTESEVARLDEGDEL